MAQSPYVVRPAAGQSSLVVAPAMAGAIAPLRPIFSGAPTADPGDVVAGDATSLGAGLVRLTTQNPAVVSRLPSAMAIWETTALTDVFGDSVADLDLVDIGDIIAAQVWASNTAAPTDVCIAFGFSAGTVNTTNVGCCVMIQASAGAWLVHHGVNTGAGWAYTAAAATDSLTRGGALQAIIGTALTQARVNAYGLDAVLEAIRTVSSQTAPTTSAIVGGFDRAFIGVGFATGVGGSAATLDIGCSSLIMRPYSVPTLFPFPSVNPAGWPTAIRRIVWLGHSMAHGQDTVTDGTYAGTAVQAGWTFRDGGVNSATWPATTSPGCSGMPWAVADAVARGATDGNRYIIRRSTPGISIGSNPDSLLGLARDDVNTLALGAPDLVVIWLGANDAQTQAELDAYRARNGIWRLAALARAEFPGAVIALMGERTTDAINYPFIDDGQIHQAKLAAKGKIPFSIVVSATSPTNIALTDAIHPSHGASGGHRAMAERLIPAAMGL